MSVYRLSLYASLIICAAGVLYRLVRAGLRRIDAPPAGPDRPPTPFPARIRSLFGEIFLQAHVFREDRFRWMMHQCLLWGFTLLIFMHALDDVVSIRIFSDYAPTRHPFRMLRNLFGGLALLGLLMAVFRRLWIRGLRRTNRAGDWLVPLLLGSILITGFFLESVMILSPSVFNDMTADYLGSDDPADIQALRAYWARDFGVVFGGGPVAGDSETIAAGKALHEETCAMCHTRPSEAFVSWPLAAMLRPATTTLEAWRIRDWLWYGHVLACFAALALLPFTKLFHMLATPLGMAGRELAPATVLERLAGPDACTRCGLCSLHCSVLPVYLMGGNPHVLPSEKLASLKRWMSGKSISGPELAAFSAGSFACTECYRCTQLCPSRIHLQDLWRAGKAALRMHGVVETHILVRRRSASRWAETIRNSASEVVAPPGLTDRPETFRDCVQCTTCTSVCPVVALSDDPEGDLDFTPQQVMNLMRLRLKELALGARMVWDCTTCYLCQEHCPQGVRVADVMYELRNIAAARLKERS